MDTDGAATFSGMGNIIYFFMDDFQTLLNHPPEAGSGLVDRIRIDHGEPAALRARQLCHAHVACRYRP